MLLLYNTNTIINNENLYNNEKLRTVAAAENLINQFLRTSSSSCGEFSLWGTLWRDLINVLINKHDNRSPRSMRHGGRMNLQITSQNKLASWT
jgi:hypothetical protein